MAHRRGRSVPGHREGHLRLNGGEPVNPFWSQGVQEAAWVDRLRPANLPPIRVTPESLPPVPADEWDGDETPRPVQGLPRAMGSGGGLLRSQGQMPTQVAFETPSSWDPQTPRPKGTQVFRMDEETSNFNLFEFEEDLAHQSSCAGIPQVDLLGPLGGEGHRGKGQGGNDQGGREGQRAQQGQQRDELDTSSWESIPSRATPTTPTNRQTKDVAKVTPGGTQLPDGPPPIDKVEKDPMPPPLPPVPPMPFGGYEEHNEAGVNKWLGPQAVHVGVRQGEGDLQGFWNSRRGGIQQVPDPEAERVQ